MKREPAAGSLALSRSTDRGLRDTPPPPPPSTPGSTSGGTASTTSGPVNMIMAAINSGIELSKNPVGYMTAHKDSTATVKDIMVNYVAVLAAIPFVATLVGYLWYYSFYVTFNYAGSFVAYAFTRAVIYYILDVVEVYIVAVILKALAPTFGSKVDEIKSLKLSAYIATPGFLLGALNIIPFLSILVIIGTLYGLYILYVGLPILLDTPKDKTLGYTITLLVAVLILAYVISAIVGLISAAAFAATFGFY